MSSICMNNQHSVTRRGCQNVSTFSLLFSRFNVFSTFFYHKKTLSKFKTRNYVFFFSLLACVLKAITYSAMCSRIKRPATTSNLLIKKTYICVLQPAFFTFQRFKRNISPCFTCVTRLSLSSPRERDKRKKRIGLQWLMGRLPIKPMTHCTQIIEIGKVVPIWARVSCTLLCFCWSMLQRRD